MVNMVVFISKDIPNATRKDIENILHNNRIKTTNIKEKANLIIEQALKEEKQMKHITIVENNRVTGVVYGEVEIDLKEQKRATQKYNQVQKIRTKIQSKIYNNTRHK